MKGGVSRSCSLRSRAARATASPVWIGLACLFARPLVGGRTAAAWISRQAVRRGLLGSSRFWFAAFVATSAVKLVRRAVGPREPVTVLSERLEPSTGIEIRHVEPDGS